MARLKGTERKTADSEPRFADLIREAARDSGRSVYRLAIEADLDQSTLNKFLSGTRTNLRLDAAEKLCRVLNLRLVGSRQERCGE